MERVKEFDKGDFICYNIWIPPYGTTIKSLLNEKNSQIEKTDSIINNNIEVIHFNNENNYINNKLFEQIKSIQKLKYQDALIILKFENWNIHNDFDQDKRCKIPDNIRRNMIRYRIMLIKKKYISDFIFFQCFLNN